MRMGAGIGLLSLLVGVAIIFIVMFSGPGGGYVPTVLNKGKQAQDQSQQISGHSDSGRAVADTVKFDEVDGNDRSFRRVKIVSMDPDCPFLLHYHMQPGDEVSEIGGMNVRDNQDYKLAVALMEEAWGKMEAIKFERNGVTYEVHPDGPLTQTGVFAAPSVTTQPSQMQ